MSAHRQPQPPDLIDRHGSCSILAQASEHSWTTTRPQLDRTDRIVNGLKRTWSFYRLKYIRYHHRMVLLYDTRGAVNMALKRQAKLCSLLLSEVSRCSRRKVLSGLQACNVPRNKVQIRVKNRKNKVV